MGRKCMPFRQLYKRNESMQRYTAHAAAAWLESVENYRDAMQSAAQLGFAMPHMQALGIYADRSQSKQWAPEAK